MGNMLNILNSNFLAINVCVCVYIYIYIYNLACQANILLNSHIIIGLKAYLIALNGTGARKKKD